MKANELMIDDWYLASKQHSPIDGDYTLEFYPKKLTIDDLIFAKNNDWDEFTKPIPLTAKILETNGWQKENDGLYWYDDKYDEEQVYVYCPVRRNGYVRKLEICNNRKSYISDVGEVVYVHELQHALRLCGLSELVDNFKI